MVKLNNNNLILVGATISAYLGRDKARKTEQLSNYIKQYNALLADGDQTPRLAEKDLFDSLISKLDGILERNVIFWKSVEEVHFRKKELERFITNHKLTNLQSNEHLKPEWKELDDKNRNLKMSLVIDAELLKSEINSTDDLVPVKIKTMLNQVALIG